MILAAGRRELQVGVLRASCLPMSSRSSPLAGESFRLASYARPACRCRHDPRRLPARVSGWRPTRVLPADVLMILAACRREFQVGVLRASCLPMSSRSSPLAGESFRLASYAHPACRCPHDPRRLPARVSGWRPTRFLPADRRQDSRRQAARIYQVQRSLRSTEDRLLAAGRRGTSLAPFGECVEPDHARDLCVAQVTLRVPRSCRPEAHPPARLSAARRGTNTNQDLWGLTSN